MPLSRPITSPSSDEAITDEINRVSARIASQHSPVMDVACLVHLTRTSLHSLTIKHSAGIGPLLAVGRACTDSYLRERGITRDELEAAVKALQSACRAEPVHLSLIQH